MADVLGWMVFLWVAWCVFDWVRGIARATSTDDDRGEPYGGPPDFGG